MIRSILRTLATAVVAIALASVWISTWTDRDRPDHQPERWEASGDVESRWRHADALARADEFDPEPFDHQPWDREQSRDVAFTVALDGLLGGVWPNAAQDARGLCDSLEDSEPRLVVDALDVVDADTDVKLFVLFAEHVYCPGALDGTDLFADEGPLDGIVEIADVIGWCESRDDWQADNPQSTASGRYQFLDGTWQWTWSGLIGEDPPTARAKHASRHDQNRAFAALYRHEGLTPWAASKRCWSDHLP